MSKKGYIYKYTFPNGKVYIGQTRVSVRDRHYQHMSAANDPERRTVCEAAIKKYGEPQLEIIETIEVEDTQITKLIGLLDEAEKKWIDKYDSTNREKGYNIMLGGQMQTPDDYILQEKWYELFEKQKWGESISYFQYILYGCIKQKILVTHKTLDKEERYVWYGYKFMDYDYNKETTFSGFYNRHKDDPGIYDIGDFDYKENGEIDEPEDKEGYVFDRTIRIAIEEHWIEDIRQTIWKEIMKYKEKIINEWYSNK